MTGARGCTLLALAGLLALPGGAVAEGELPGSSCVACHSDADLFETEDLAIVEGFRDDVHAAAGLSCVDCHGGNADGAVADDLDAAMDPEFGPNPYRGAPERTAVPAFCGRCHSDPDVMKRFKPGVRVDQEREYRTSHHGRALAAGDEDVATCVDCHGVHGIRSVGDPESPVYPTHVADTCGRCHSDPERMAGHRLDDGRPIPVDQYARWRRSVHAQALLEREDLSAPTCNDCHGNHGAAPPGLESVSFVCGQCHGREAGLFRESGKRQALEEHNEYLEEAGSEGCVACHDTPEPAAAVTDLRAFGECTSCHGNHGIVRPSVAMLSPLPPMPCDFCHDVLRDGVVSDPESDAIRRHFEAVRDELLASAREAGLEGTELFDWLVEEARRLPTHTVRSPEEGGEPGLLPEFENLFAKFRIGKTHYEFMDPASGGTVRAEVVRCSRCHGTEADNGDSTGAATAAELLGRMRELTMLTARAERLLLAARRGGVETRSALAEIEQAVDREIELQALVHTFSVAEDSPFRATHQEGMEHARAALDAGQRALEEVQYRRRGLAVFAILVLLVLVALGFKLQELPGGLP